MPSTSILVFQIPGDPASRVEVRVDREIVVGRAEGSGAHLPNPGISRRHARFYLHEGKIVVEDLGSSNGTLVNGTRITGPTYFGVQDVATLGPYEARGGPAAWPSELPATVPAARAAAGVPAAVAPEVIEAPTVMPSRQSAPAARTPPQAGSPADWIVRVARQTTGEVIDVPLPEATLTIGRLEGCEVVLAADGVSRKHASITRIGDVVVIRDLGSRNGIEVNGQNVPECSITPQDVVRIRDYQLRAGQRSMLDQVASPAALRGRAFVIIEPDSRREVREDVIVVGRSSDAHIVLPSDRASRRHASLHADGERLRMVDLGSSNGTYVNGRQVTECPVGNGDEIIVGAYSMRLTVTTETYELEVLPIGERSEALRRSTDPLDQGVVVESVRLSNKDLRKVPVLEALTQELMNNLVTVAQIGRIGPGQAVYYPGRISDRLYVVVSGRVDEIRREGSARTILTSYGPGDFFGDSSLTSGSGDVLCETAQSTVIVGLPREEVTKAKKKCKPFATILDERYRQRALESHLRGIDLFREVDAAAIRALQERAKLVTLAKGETLLEEGAPGEAFFLIRSGFCKVAKSKGPAPAKPAAKAKRDYSSFGMEAGPADTQVSGEKVLAYVRAGSYVGETAILTGQPSEASVSAMTEVEVVRIERADFAPILSRYPQIAAELKQTLEMRDLKAIEASESTFYGRMLDFAVSQGVMSSSNLLVVDLHKCIRCDDCIKGCEAHHGQSRFTMNGVRFDNLLVVSSCRNCENPECLIGCPTGNITRDLNGQIHFLDKCIGCSNCARLCPYGDIIMVEAGDHAYKEQENAPLGAVSEKRPQKVATKCDMCQGFTYQACVKSCPTGAAQRVNPQELFARLGGVS